jgi:hypothetical protein
MRPVFFVMAQYAITTSFSAADLERFYATGSNIVLARPLSGVALNMAWVVYRPFQKNYLGWNDDFAIYASDFPIQNGVVPQPNAQTDPNFPVQLAMVYTMQPAGTITGPVTSGGAAGAFMIDNEYQNTSGYLAFGLRQPATIEGKASAPTAASAITVLQGTKGILTPAPAVYLWVQPNIVSGTVVTVFTAPITKVALTAATPSADLLYQSATGTFTTTTPGVLTSVTLPKL